jgi:hypothetical protein
MPPVLASSAHDPPEQTSFVVQSLFCVHEPVIPTQVHVFTSHCWFCVAHCVEQEVVSQVMPVVHVPVEVSQVSPAGQSESDMQPS